MESNDIIKDLECCSSQNCCEYCGLKSDKKNCVSTLCKNAHDLITHQQAEIENLKVENQSLRSAANSLKMHYEEAQAKIEEFMKETAVTTLIDDAVVYTPTLEDYNKFKKMFKSKAVKEFAERIKELIQTKEFTDDVAMLMCAFVDNICKEMVGDDNE